MHGMGNPGRLWLLALTLATPLIATACGGAAPPPAPTPAPEAEPEPTAEPTAEPAAEPADTGLLAGLVTPALLSADLDTVEASLFDQGKMWTFEFPPTEYLADEYGFRPDEAWFEKARLASLRIVGCSASFVSPHGLVMTNHHCAREHVSQVSREGEELLENGFYARSLAEERPLGEDFHADQLIALEDVTEAVESRLAAVGEEERARQREAVLETVGDSVAGEYGGEAEDIVVEVISLWNGGYYSAYVFRRYRDVKLVMAPELQIGFFGGDPDNFTYPRYNLDFAFLRVYDDGEPLDSDPYFAWDHDGAQPGEPIFIIGNPGSTTRLQAVSQLEFRRDVSDRYLLEFLRDRVRLLRSFAEEHPEAAERVDLINTIFSLENAEKSYEGQLGGLEDVNVLARRLRLQQAFRDSILTDPGLRAEYGGVFEELAELQARKREVAPGYGAFLALSADFASATLRRALLAFQVLNARTQEAPAEQVDELMNGLREVERQPTELDRTLMAARFRDFIRYYGEDEPWVQEILEGRSPDAAAAAIQQGSLLADSARAVAAVEDGAVERSDPALQVVMAYLQPFSRFQQVLAQVSAREEEIMARLGRARLEVYGQAVPPDATFSLRLADGVVDSYEYNGTIAPTHTTFHGLYDHYHSYARMYEDARENPWRLPERWQTPPAGLDLTTALNFVSTADIIGGNSGSPVVDRDLEVVGLVFDGNIDSLPGDYIFLPELNRSVSVDVRGMLEALEEVYQMERLVTELTTGRLDGAAP
ncbi:MAG: S46 family peptidase [Gemmatimonadota bacterium]